MWKVLSHMHSHTHQHTILYHSFMFFFACESLNASRNLLGELTFHHQVIRHPGTDQPKPVVGWIVCVRVCVVVRECEGENVN